MSFNRSRRKFLLQLGGAAAAGATSPLWLEFVQRGGLPSAWGIGEGDTLPVGSPVIVHISMQGGNDYLNTLVPMDDAWYHDNSYGHGAISLTPAETLALNGSPYRLHNKLQWLADRWNTVGDVGFALGAGNMAINFSHFDSMKFWDTARLDVLGKTGWLGRYADVVRPQNALASVSINDLQAEAIGATAPMFVLSECSAFTYDGPWLSNNVFVNGAKQMATISGTNKVADVARMMATTFDVTGRVKGADDPATTGTSAYSGQHALTKSLIQAALLIKAGIPAQSYAVGWGGHDSHTNQKQMQSDNFTHLNNALGQFFSLLAGHPRANDVFVMINSEFGRQATANKDNGTDHGQAGMAIFIGGGVQRGVFGLAPTLNPGGPTRPNRIADALKPTVDFRSIHATVLNRLAKGDTNVADAVLGAHYEDLGVFGATAPTTTTTPPTTAANKPPVAVMTLSAQSGPAPLTVNADGSGSSDPDGYVKAYKWYWGDGTTASTKTSSHTYSTPGTYTLQLAVTDNRGGSAKAKKTVTVT